MIILIVEIGFRSFMMSSRMPLMVELAPQNSRSCYYTLILAGRNTSKTRSSWVNCALRDEEAVYWVSIGHYEAVAVGN